MQRYWMTDGMTDLDLLVPEGTDTDGEFIGTCVDTGDQLRVRGWMLTECAELPL